MSELNPRIEELRQEALAKVRSERLDEAIALYDEALGLASDEEVRELITINKAETLIAVQRGGPEVQALPMILMRRRNARHTFLTAYALMYKHSLLNETKRAIFYGQIALDAANDANQSIWKLRALNEFGLVYQTDSQFSKAMECFEQALACVEQVSDGTDTSFSRVAIIGNLGYTKLISGDTKEGLRLLHSVIDEIPSPQLKSDTYVDLCYGYLDLQQYEKARLYGEISLDLACEPRQVRNAHYLLGEAAYKTGDLEAAEYHFEELARFYPQFRNMKSLLFAIDLRSMINLKL
ncbi:MAG TPA: tetratricopeptide repeat protein [Thermoanaerobaculia bacterium]|nr:tetratricopeptide repeat protein [Thermoanaerobaculia bacterium]